MFDYSFKRQSSSEDSHDDELVIQDSEPVWYHEIYNNFDYLGLLVISGLVSGDY